jgi:hypothetical protein
MAHNDGFQISQFNRKTNGIFGDKTRALCRANFQASLCDVFGLLHFLHHQHLGNFNLLKLALQARRAAANAGFRQKSDKLFRKIFLLAESSGFE